MKGKKKERKEDRQKGRNQERKEGRTKPGQLWSSRDPSWRGSSGQLRCIWRVRSRSSTVPSTGSDPSASPKRNSRRCWPTPPLVPQAEFAHGVDLNQSVNQLESTNQSINHYSPSSISIMNGANQSIKQASNDQWNNITHINILTVLTNPILAAGSI